MQPSAAMAQPPALAPGVVLLHRYMIEGYIGGGGFGHIYRARDIALGHLRAIKEAFSRDPNTQRQFRLEAEFLLNARHPNLVRGYSVFESAGRLYLVMDYVDGHTLEDLAIEAIKRTHRPPIEAQVLDWMLPICDAVHELHSQPAPIIHRDIKPANIKLSITQNIPILIDLGLAKLFAQGQQTIAAALAFTPGYAPPEQYQAAGMTDQRTDIYGLGATLYYLLTGYQPVEAPARISAQALPTPRERNPLLSERVDRLVLRAMALDPNERFQCAKDLASELAACRAELVEATETSTTAPSRLCAHCGGSSPAEAGFCMRCGHALWAEPWQTAPVVAIPRPVAPAPAVLPAYGAQLRSAPAAAHNRPTQPSAAAWARPSPQQRGLHARGEWRQRVGPAGLGPAGAGAAAVVAPPALWRRPGPWLTPLEHAAPATPREAQVCLAAFLAVVCVALSLTAPFNPPMAIFCAPGLALGAWSLAHMGETAAPREFRWIAAGALLLGSLWLLALILRVALLVH
ncbi:MAG TPA: serine/threonine-protein kinase [Ktedonobacterales bacterium]